MFSSANRRRLADGHPSRFQGLAGGRHSLGVLAAGRLFPAALCRQKNRQKITDRRGCMVAAASGLIVSSLAAASAHYRRLSCCAVSSWRYSRISGRFRAGAHRPGAGDGIGFCTTLGAAFSFFQPRSFARKRSSVFSTACRAAGAGPFHCCAHAVVGAQKPARRREQARRRDCRIAAVV